MLGIASIITAFIATVIGLRHSHAAKAEKQFAFGLSKIGVSLIILAVFALGFGLIKEVKTARTAKELAAKSEYRDQMLMELHAAVLGVKDQVQDQQTRESLQLVLERITATASNASESDFSMSNFTRSNFANGNFTQANFQGSLFHGANLAGADLSEAYIDENTKLPK